MYHDEAEREHRGGLVQARTITLPGVLADTLWAGLAEPCGDEGTYAEVIAKRLLELASLDVKPGSRGWARRSRVQLAATAVIDKLLTSEAKPPLRNATPRLLALSHRGSVEEIEHEDAPTNGNGDGKAHGNGKAT